MIAKRIGVLLVTVTMVASGAYVLVYLQRWEWNRALIAGTFMLASEMILVAAVLAGRIRAVERKVTAAVDRTQQERVLRRLREAPGRPSRPLRLAPSHRHRHVRLRARADGRRAGAVRLSPGSSSGSPRPPPARPWSAAWPRRLVGFSVPDEPLVEADTDPLALGAHAILLRPQSGSAP